jgi:hypothetical protein
MAANPPVVFDAQQANAKLQGITDPVQYGQQFKADMDLYARQKAAQQQAARTMTQFDQTVGGASTTSQFPTPPPATSPTNGGSDKPPISGGEHKKVGGGTNGPVNSGGDQRNVVPGGQPSTGNHPPDTGGPSPSQGSGPFDTHAPAGGGNDGTYSAGTTSFPPPSGGPGASGGSVGNGAVGGPGANVGAPGSAGGSWAGGPGADFAVGGGNRVGGTGGPGSAGSGGSELQPGRRSGGSAPSPGPAEEPLGRAGTGAAAGGKTSMSTGPLGRGERREKEEDEEHTSPSYLIDNETPAIFQSDENTPSALRWLIGTELRTYRKNSGRVASAAAALLNCAEAKISHMETGRYRQSPEDVAELMRFYGATGIELDRLVSLAARDDDSTWWAPFSDVVPDWLQTFVGLERLADQEFTYEPTVLPGLLQTESYAAALTTASPRVRQDRASRFVAFRLNRQHRLADEDRPLELTAVIEEAALRRPVGDAAVRRAQYEYLLELLERPNVAIRVLPQALAVHAGLQGRFTVLTFTDVRSIGFVEMQEGGVYIQDEAQVDGYRLTSESLSRDALDRRGSALLITSLISELS